jgi:CheY-like chemotaxis protein
LNKIIEDKPDIVLLDIMMPQISGYDVCKSIKENDATHFIPVVMCTALSGT